MIIGSLMLATLVGGAFGIAAFAIGFGLLQSLAIYALAGQSVFLIAPLLSFFGSVIADDIPMPQLARVESGSAERFES